MTELQQEANFLSVATDCDPAILFIEGSVISRMLHFLYVFACLELMQLINLLPADGL
jgi:hypothetical protein